MNSTGLAWLPFLAWAALFPGVVLQVSQAREPGISTAAVATVLRDCDAKVSDLASGDDSATEEPAGGTGGRSPS